MHRFGKAFVFAIAASIAAMPAAAAVITPGNVPQIDENLLSTGDTGNPVTALTSPSAFEVTISGTENLVTPAAGSQLTVAAADGGFSTLTFSLADPGSTFSTLILNLDVSQNGTVTFTDDVSGTSGAFVVDGNGLNFFTLTGGPFTSISLTTQVLGSEAAILSAVTNVRLGGVTLANPSAVPEPGSWAFMLLGFGIAGLALRKRKTARVSAGA